jgi:hypothetical protein
MNGDRLHNAMETPPEARIDAALHSIGSATPRSGLEGRILTRVAAERITMEAAPPSTLWLRGFPARALALVTVCLIGFVIVAGSVSHSRSIRPLPAAAPSLVLPGQGIGAASAVHPAAPASAPIPAGQGGRSGQRSSQGRARIAPHARKAPGVAIPAPASNKSSSSD